MQCVIGVCSHGLASQGPGCGQGGGSGYTVPSPAFVRVHPKTLRPMGLGCQAIVEGTERRLAAMPRNVWEIPINSETTVEDLQRVLIAAEHTGEINTQKAAAKVQAELQRREQQRQDERFNAESKERVKALRVQEKLVDRQIDAQEKWMVQQLEVAKDQAKTARGAEQAAKWSAVATVAIAILTAFLAFIAAITLLSI